MVLIKYSDLEVVLSAAGLSMERIETQQEEIDAGGT